MCVRCVKACQPIPSLWINRLINHMNFFYWKKIPSVTNDAPRWPHQYCSRGMQVTCREHTMKNEPFNSISSPVPSSWLDLTPLNRKGHYIDYFVVTSCIWGGRGDYLKYSPLLQSSHRDCLSVSITLRTRPNGRDFTDGRFQCFFLTINQRKSTLV